MSLPPLPTDPFQANASERMPWLPARFKTLLVYSELIAARRAMDRLVRIIRHSCRGAVLHPMLWRFDQLEDPRWHEPSLADAAEAALIVLAMKDSLAFSPETSRWLTSVLSRKSGAVTQVMVLSANDEPWMISIEEVLTANREPQKESRAAANPAFGAWVTEEYLAKSA